MGKALYAIILFATSQITLNAQDPEFAWARQMGGTSEDRGHSIAIDGNGNVYTTGDFSGTSDFDPSSGTYNLTSFGYADVFVSKLDASGNFVWAIQIGGISFDYGYSIAVDGNGNVYTTGFFQGTCDFDPSSGTYNLTPFGYADVFVSKLDASGNFVWAKQFGGTTNANNIGHSIAIDGNGNVYTTGYFSGTSDFDPSSGTYNLTSFGITDVFVSKLDASGNFVWAKQFGGTSADEGFSIAFDGNGNVYTTGYFTGTSDFDPSSGTYNLTSFGSGDVFVSKLDASGNFVWAKQFGGTSANIGSSIAVDDTENVYTTGYFVGTCDFDPSSGTYNLTSSGQDDIFVSKLDASGNFVWAKRIGAPNSDRGHSIAVDSNGNVYTTGYFAGICDFDPSSETYNLTSFGSGDIFVLKLDASGNFIWAKQMGGTDDEGGYSIAIDGNGNVYTAGEFYGICDFDPSSETYNLTSFGENDIFVSKFEEASSCIDVSITIQPQDQSVTAPNPANFNVSVNGTSPFTYQWQVSSNGGSNWSNLSNSGNTTWTIGGNSSTLTIHNSTGLDDYEYRCVVSNSCPSSITSDEATLTVTAACISVSITSNPSNQSVVSPDQAMFSVSVDGTAPFTFQWQVSTNGGGNWSNLSNSGNTTWTTGGNSSTLTIANSTGLDDYQYRCVVSNSCPSSVTSDAATLTVTTACISVSISSNPSNQTVISPDQAMFSVSVAGTTPFTFQWQVSTNGGTIWSNLVNSGNTTWTTGGSNSTLTLGNSTGLDAYRYRCIISNSCPSSITSNSATLVVNSGGGITITSSIIPPWQRESDSYQESVTVSTSPPGSSWHLQVRVTNSSNGNLITTINYPSITLSTQNFFSADPQLQTNSLNGRQLTYYAVLDANGSSQQAGFTTIIEKKWNNINTVFYNTAGQELKIPLKYFPNTTSITYYIARLPGKSSKEDFIVFGIPNLPGNNNQYISFSYANSNLKNVNPGVFKYSVTYNGTGVQEQGIFDLSKIGNLGNNGTNSIVVLVGGNVNIEDAIFRLPSQYNQYSPACWSIANSFVENGKNTWYIGTSNLNPLQKNAYNIGKALEKIKTLSNASAPEISIFAHSKGGLEVRMMLDGKGAPNENLEDFSLNPSHPFTNTTIDNTLKTVIFLGTPHNDGVEAGYITDYVGLSIAPSHYVNKQINKSQIISYFLNGTNVPNGIRIGNISAYSRCDFSDGAVSLGSSSSPVLLGINTNLITNYFVKDIGAPEIDPIKHITIGVICNVICNSAFLISTLLPQPALCGTACELTYTYYELFRSILWKRNFHHLHLTSGFVLNNSEDNSCLFDGYQNTSTFSKILSIINNNGIVSCTNPLNQACPSTFMQLISSYLADAQISKSDGDGQFLPLTTSDENGIFNISYGDDLEIGDSIKIEAPGVETLFVGIQSSMFANKKVIIPMIKKEIASLNISFPQFSLLNINPIIKDSVIQISVHANNAIDYEYNLNNDSTYTALILTDGKAFISLDTGINLIAIKYNGPIDTVILYKNIYYLPDSLYYENTYSVYIKINSENLGTKLYLNNVFYKSIDILVDTIDVFNGQNVLKFQKFGYVDSLINVDSSVNIILQSGLQPKSFTPIQNDLMDFTAGNKIKYSNNVTILDSLQLNSISINQSIDMFDEKGLFPQSRKFRLERLNSSADLMKFAAVLDQTEELNVDNIYLLSVYDDTIFNKLYFDGLDNEVQYNSDVQKLTFNNVTFNNGNSVIQDLVLMEKKVPIVKFYPTITMEQNSVVQIPLNLFFSDPDSIPNDITYTISHAEDLSVHLENSSNVFIKTNKCFVGTSYFTLKAIHDELEIIDTIYFEISPFDIPSISLDGDSILCSGDSLILTASSGYSYKWNNGETTKSIVVKQSGEFTVMVIDSNGCESTSSIVNVGVLPSPSPEILPSGSTEFCLGDSVLLTSSEGATYNWNSGDTTQSITTYSSGNYYVTVIDSNGCNAVSNQINITVNDLPLVDLGPDSISVESNTMLDAKNLGATYKWSTGDSTQTILVTVPGTYSVLVTDINGCSSNDTIFVDITTDVIQLNETEQLKIYPNPNAGTFTLSADLTTTEVLKLKVTNSIGQVVYSLNPEIVSGRISKEINLKNANTGIYYIQIELGNNKYVSKIIISN